MLPQITIDGRLVDDPELRFTTAGKAVCSMRVAASDSKKDDTGNWQTTERIFINVTLWEAEGEAAAEHFRKGDSVLVSGRIYQREYEKNDGTKGYSLEVKFPTIAKTLAVPRADRQQAASRQQTAASDPWASVGAPSEPPF